MNDNATHMEALYKRAQDYGKTSIELFKLNAIDKSADVVSSLVSSLAVIVSVTLSLLIINIGCALWIGNLLGESFYGFFVIGGFYALLALMLYIFRDEWIKNPVCNSIIKQLLKQKRKL